MKAICFCAVVTFAVSLAASPRAVAGTQEGAVLALHAKAHTTKAATVCTTWKPVIPCSYYLTDWPILTSADVYLVVAKAPSATAGIAGVSCGILYDNVPGSGVDVFSWTLCADIEYPNGAARCSPELPPCEWPISGGGNRITWVSTTNCQRTVLAPDGVHAVAGAFYVYAYSPVIFQITPNLNLEIPELSVADCNASTTYLSMGGLGAGAVAFGYGSGHFGCNPCIEWCAIGDPWGTPIRRTTWGGIKRAY